jgi:hypothetical protein
MGSVRFQAQPNPHVNGRVVVAEIVQRKKRIEILGLAGTEGALKPDSRAFDGLGIPLLLPAPTKSLVKLNECQPLVQLGLHQVEFR